MILYRFGIPAQTKHPILIVTRYSIIYLFVISFHSNDSLSVKINDILEGNMHKASLGILMDHYYDAEHEDLLIDSESCEDHEILKIKLNPLKAYIFGVLNCTDSRQKIEVDCKKSAGYFFSPLNGVFRRKVSAGKIEYLGASIGNKEEKKKKLKYQTEAEEIEESDEPESDDNEGEDSDKTDNEEESDGDQEGEESEDEESDE